MQRAGAVTDLSVAQGVLWVLKCSLFGISYPEESMLSLGSTAYNRFALSRSITRQNTEYRNSAGALHVFV